MRRFACRHRTAMAAKPVQEEEDASELKLGQEFERAQCLMNAEVAQILEAKLEHLKKENPSEDPLSQVTPVFAKSLEYVQRFRSYKNQEAVNEVRKVLKEAKLHEFEMCVVGNLCPETAEEMQAMVPSLTNPDRENPLSDEAIEALHGRLQTIRKFE